MHALTLWNTAMLQYKLPANIDKENCVLSQISNLKIFTDFAGIDLKHVRAGAILCFIIRHDHSYRVKHIHSKSVSGRVLDPYTGGVGQFWAIILVTVTTEYKYQIISYKKLKNNALKFTEYGYTDLIQKYYSTYITLMSGLVTENK